MPIVAPSILAADFLNLQSAVYVVENSEAEWYHLDVMDGVFVPNISYGFPVLDALKKVAQKPMDVHLMIIEPERFLQRFIDAGSNSISIHYEACKHLHSAIYTIKNGNVKAGVAINPHTPVQNLKDVLKDLDFVNVMSVNPGFGGQKFIQNTFDKIDELLTLKKELNTDFLIEIDGGVNLENANELVARGADVLVAGSSVFGSKDPVATISQLKQA